MAQSTPEFKLKLHFIDVKGASPKNLDGFGYDAMATDSLDPVFGEAEYPGPTTGGLYVAFELPAFYSPGDPIYSGTDIRPKPATESFSISYKLFASPFRAPGTLSWDHAAIPQGVTAIRITPYGQDSPVLAEMTVQDSVSVDFSSSWWPAGITLYYNMQPPQAVVHQESSTHALILSAAGYPNPIHESGKVGLELSMPATVILTGYDEAGRECLHQTQMVPSGPTSLSLSDLTALHGSILLHIEAVSTSTTETRNILVVKE